MAVSCESMTAAVPSRVAFATSAPPARGAAAAGLHPQLAPPARGAHLDDAQAHGPVGEVQGGVFLDGVGEPGPGDAHLVRVALELIAAADHEALAGRELDDAFAH